MAVHEAIRALVPDVTLPAALNDTRTAPLLDAFPLLSMILALPALRLFWRTHRHADLVIFGGGFLLACFYHYCHLSGLASSQLFGIAGHRWRSLDVTFANFCLGRTFAHALGASHPLSVGIANGVFPAAILAMQQRHGHVTLGSCCKVLGVVLCGTLAAKLALEGWKSFPDYSVHGRRAAGLMAAGLLVFPVPTFLPAQYWLWHSIWHLVMFQGYWELYTDLERQQLAELSRKQHFSQTSRQPGREACSVDSSGNAAAAKRQPPSSLHGLLTVTVFGHKRSS